MILPEYYKELDPSTWLVHIATIAARSGISLVRIEANINRNEFYLKSISMKLTLEKTFYLL